MELNDYMYDVIRDEFRRYAQESGELNEEDTRYQLDIDAYEDDGTATDDAYYEVTFRCYCTFTHYKGDWYQPSETEVRFRAEVESITYVWYRGYYKHMDNVTFDSDGLVIEDEVYFA